MNPVTVKLVLGNRCKEAGIKANVSCYKSFRPIPYDIYYSKYSDSFSISVYGNCTDADYPEIIAICKSKKREAELQTINYSFHLSSIGEVFRRDSPLFDGIPVTEDEESLLIAMQSNDVTAWQVYTDWLEEAGHTLQAHYIRHYVNVHLRRVGQ